MWQALRRSSIANRRRHWEFCAPSKDVQLTLCGAASDGTFTVVFGPMQSVLNTSSNGPLDSNLVTKLTCDSRAWAFVCANFSFLRGRRRVKHHSAMFWFSVSLVRHTINCRMNVHEDDR